MFPFWFWHLLENILNLQQFHYSPYICSQSRGHAASVISYQSRFWSFNSNLKFYTCHSHTEHRWCGRSWWWHQEWQREKYPCRAFETIQVRKKNQLKHLKASLKCHRIQMSFCAFRVSICSEASEKKRVWKKLFASKIIECGCVAIVNRQEAGCTSQPSVNVMTFQISIINSQKINNIGKYTAHRQSF